MIRARKHLRHQFGNIVSEMEHIRRLLRSRHWIESFHVNRYLNVLHLREDNVSVHPDQRTDADRLVETDVADAFQSRTIFAKQKPEGPAQFGRLAHYEAAEDRVVEVAVLRVGEDYVG